MKERKKSAQASWKRGAMANGHGNKMWDANI